MTKKITLLLSAFGLAMSMSSQLNGTMDATFASGGIFTHDFGSVDVLYGVEVQDDGKIVAAGVALDANYAGEMKVIRLLNNGTPDPEFGDAGIVALPLNNESYGYDLLIKENGQILIAGISAIQPYVYAMSVTQLNTDGSVDSGFGTNGTTIINLGAGDEYAYAMTLQSDGKILLAGNALDANYYNVPTVIRLTAEGDLDTSFSGDGVAQYPVTETENELRCIAVQSDGKIVTGGHYAPNLFDVNVLLLRFNEDGTLDETFGVAGAVKDTITVYGADECYGLVIDNEDNIIITGYASTIAGWDAFVKKYDSEGSVDNTFGTDGITFSGFEASDVAYGIVQSPNLGFLVTGTAGNFPDETFALWRLNTDGSFNTDFGTDGAVYTNIGVEPEEANALAVQDDSHVIIAGKTRGETTNFDFAVLRYNDAPAAVDEISDLGDWSVYPNPVRSGNRIMFTSNSANNRLERIELFDTEGKMIQSESSTNSGNGSFMLSNRISAGAYQVRLYTTEKTMEVLSLVVTE